jgi:thymidylate synthase (FAD)
MTETNLKVTYITHSGNDMSPVNAARISRDAQTLGKIEVNEKDKKLMEFLAKNHHMTPFEHASLTVLIECPLYIRSQIHRHRTFSYNEVSRRYTSEGIKFYIPEVIHLQGLDDKQKSGHNIDKDIEQEIKNEIKSIDKYLEEKYNEFLNKGMSREDARMILPNNLITKFYMSGNIRNWAHFMELRLDDHAQYETQVIAQEVLKITMKHFPETMKTLIKHTNIDNVNNLNEILSGDY